MNAPMPVLLAARDWAEQHRHASPDDRLVNLIYDAGRAATQGQPALTAEAVRRLVSALGPRPCVVVCCGSTRFADAIIQIERALSLAGHLVISYSTPLPGEPSLTDQQISLLADRHRNAIDLADAVIVVNPDGYVGEATLDEVNHARRTGTDVFWLEPDRSDQRGAF